MNKSLAAVIVLAGLCSSTGAFAQLDPAEATGYFGGAIGLSHTYPDSGDYADGQPGATTTAGSRQSFGWRAYAGEQFNRFLGFEFGYAGLGKYRNNYSVPAIGGTGTGNNKLSAIDLAATGTLPFNEGLSLHGKLGVAFVKNEYTFAGSGPGTGYLTSDSGAGRATNRFVGLGLQAHFSRHAAVTLDYESFGKVGTPTNNLTTPGATGVAKPALVSAGFKLAF